MIGNQQLRAKDDKKHKLNGSLVYYFIIENHPVEYSHCHNYLGSLKQHSLNLISSVLFPEEKIKTVWCLVCRRTFEIHYPLGKLRMVNIPAQQVLNASEIICGGVYVGRRGEDRSVVWISSSKDLVQYDSKSISYGRKLPIITMEKFLNWALEIVKEKLDENILRTKKVRDESTRHNSNR